MRKKLKSNKGASLVSILAAFTILLIVLGIFYSAIRFSNNMIVKSTDMREAVESELEEYYLHASEQSTVLDDTLIVVSESDQKIIELPLTLRQMNSTLKYFAHE